MSEVTLEGILYALSDPVRLQIARKLTAQGCPLNCQSAAPPAMAKSSISHHYQILREAGLIRSERRGVQVVNSMRCDELSKRFPGLLKAIFEAADAKPKKER